MFPVLDYWTETNVTEIIFAYMHLVLASNLLNVSICVKV